MRATKSSISQAISLKPEVEFEVIKLILLRERCLQRLHTKLKTSKGKVDIGIIGAFDTLRDATIETVETIDMWEKTQVNYPLVKPFMWNGQNYLVKMTTEGGDTAFLSEFPEVTSWLGFNAGENNPFLVPTETYGEDFKLAANTYIVFGNRPVPLVAKAVNKKKGRYLKSPYATPLFNDVAAAASDFVKASLAKEKLAAKVVLRKQANKTEDVDIYENYLSAEAVVKIRRCWKILIRVNPDLRYIYSTSLKDFSHSFNASFNYDSADKGPGQSDRRSTRREEDVGNDSFMANDFESFEDLDRGDDVVGEASAYSAHAATNEREAGDAGVKQLGNKSFQSSFNFVQDFQDSLHRTSSLPPNENISMRFQSLYQDDVPRDVSGALSPNNSAILNGSSFNRTQGVKLWAPHEIKLQTVVHKRGGELFVVTAAGTSGRMKAPSRKSRFERLQSDIEHVCQQENRLSMNLEEYTKQLLSITMLLKSTSEDSKKDEENIKHLKDQVRKIKKDIDELTKFWKNVNTHKRMLLYQYDRFKLLITGDINSVEKQRQLKELASGQTLEKDEMLSISLEDRMANKLQFMVRHRIASRIRKRHIALRHRSARKIQNAWRILVSHRQFQDTMIAMRHKKMIERVTTALLGKGKFMILRRDVVREKATGLIQRVVRGWMGRNRLKNKRIFVRSVDAAVQAVDTAYLSAKAIDELATFIEAYTKDTLLYIPVEVMTLLRSVLFMLNGDNPESISVIVDKKVRSENIYSASMSWPQAVKLLRRKGRLLRRMRNLAVHVQCPNATTLQFSESCRGHLSEAVKTLTPDAFSLMKAGKHCVMQLLSFVTNLYKVFQMQVLFPEYFGCSQPGWFKKLLPLRLKHEKNLIEYRICASCTEILSAERERKIASGEKYGFLSNAFNNATVALASAESMVKESNRKIIYYLNRLENAEGRRLNALADFERSKVLGVDIANRELNEYLSLDMMKDEDTISRMVYDVDDKNISLLELRSKIIHCKRAISQDIETRDFEDLFDFKEIFKAEAEVSEIVARLLVMKEEWESFMSYIGGIQFADDLRGDELDKYNALTLEIKSKVKRRRELIETLHDDINIQIRKIRRVKDEERTAYYNSHQEWDAPVDIEATAESEENYRCALREAEKAARALQTPNKLTVKSNTAVAPVLLIIDAFIPRMKLTKIQMNLSRINFIHGILSENIEEVFLLVQGGLSAGKNICLTVSRGIHRAARVAFFATLRSLKNSFVPTPRVVCVDGYDFFRRQDWHLPVSTSMSSMELYNVEESFSAVIQYGNSKHIVELLRHGIVNYEDDTANQYIRSRSIPNWFRGLIEADVIYFLEGVAKALKSSNAKIDMYDLSDAKSVESYAFLILAASVSSICGLWTLLAPSDVWDTSDIRRGAEMLLQACTTPMKLCELLDKHVLRTCTMQALKFLNGSSTFYDAWNHLRDAYGFYDHPAVVLIHHWHHATLRIFAGCAPVGGFPKFTDTELVDATLQLDWDFDMMQEGDENKLAGELLSLCFYHALVFEDVLPVIKYSMHKELHDLTRSMVVSTAELHVVRIYHQGENVYFSAQKGESAIGYDHNCQRHPVPRNKLDTPICFGFLKQNELLSLFQPNAVEIFEGRIPYFKFGRGHSKWFEVLSPWLRIQDIYKDDNLFHNVDVARARYLITSTVGHIDGHFCRVECFEECFGVIVCVIHGLPGGVQVLRFGNVEYRKLVKFCDADEEKAALDNVDVHRTALIFADRLRILPNANMVTFLSSSTLCSGPRPIPNPTAKLRFRGGPGRRLGSKVVHFEGAKFAISVYEIHNETDAYFLRVLLYDFCTSKTVEYRISPMERILLFNGMSTHVLPLIIARFKVSRVLKSEFKQDEDPLVLLDEHVVKRAQKMNYKTESKKAKGQDVYDLCFINDHVEALDRNYSGSNDSSDIEAGRQVTPITEDEVHYVLYFDRSLNEQSIGNIEASVSLCLPREGFIFTVREKINRYRVQKFVSYRDIYHVLKYKFEDFMELIDTLDDSDTVLEIFEELMEQLDTDLDDDYGSRLILNSFEPGQSPVFLAFIRPSDEPFFDSENEGDEDDESKDSSVEEMAFGGDMMAFITKKGKEGKGGYISYAAPAIDFNIRTMEPVLESEEVSDVYRRTYDTGALSELILTAQRQRVLHQVSGSTSDKLNVAEALQLATLPPALGGRRRGVLAGFINPKHVKAFQIQEKVAKYVVQKSYVYFQRNTERSVDSSRLCWRGKMAASDLSGSSESSKISMSKRSSKLTKLVSIKEAKVVDDIMEIPDEEGASEENVNMLPVVVKEVLSEGPGVVNRKYTIEIFSNNRISMGSIDIANSEDMRRVVGMKHAHLLDGPDAHRDFQALFSYIVKERLHLSMMAVPTRSQKERGRREGIAKKIAAKGAEGDGVVIGTAGSVISLERDDAIVTESAQKGIEDEASDSDLDDLHGEQTVGRSGPRIWLRLCSKRHKMSGRHFRTLVLFEHDDPLMYNRPDIFFQRASWETCVSQVTIVFKSLDTITKSVLELRVDGSEVYPWVPVNLTVDLGHKFRRGKFGQYLIDNLRLRYSIVGSYYLSLFNMY